MTSSFSLGYTISSMLTQAGQANTERLCEPCPPWIPAGRTYVGEVSGPGDLAVLGTIEGNVRVGGSLVVEEGARILGSVQAACVTVRGAVTGTVRAGVVVRVDRCGIIMGDVVAPRIERRECSKVLGTERTQCPEQLPEFSSAVSHLLLIHTRSMARNVGFEDAPPPPQFPPLVRVHAKKRRIARADNSNGQLALL